MIGDAARLRQVLLNLAGNAVKFTESGGVARHGRAGRRPDEIRFAVRDTGIGIAPDAQARIFEEFEQADGGTTRKFGGTGLGLAISRRIVERMGGASRSRARRAKVRRSASRDAAARDSGDAPGPPPDLTGKAILIVARRRSRPRWWRGGWSAGARDLPRARRTDRTRVLPERHWDAS